MLTAGMEARKSLRLYFTARRFSFTRIIFCKIFHFLFLLCGDGFFLLLLGDAVYFTGIIFLNKSPVFFQVSLENKLGVAYASEIFRLDKGGVLFDIVVDSAFSKHKAYPYRAGELVPHTVGNVESHKKERADIVCIAFSVYDKVAYYIVVFFKLFVGDGYAVNLAWYGLASPENLGVRMYKSEKKCYNRGEKSEVEEQELTCSIL